MKLSLAFNDRSRLLHRGRDNANVKFNISLARAVTSHVQLRKVGTH